MSCRHQVRLSSQQPRRRAKAWWCRVFCCLLLVPGGLASLGHAQEQDVRQAQRDLYLAAHEALDSNRMQEFAELLERLEGYPLRPYLEYAALAPRLAGMAQSAADFSAIDEFLERHPNTYLASRLERTWGRLLGIEERWSQLLRYYNPNNARTELRCYALHAQLLAGDDSALSQAAELWNVSRSQPNACDPVFAAWISAGGLTPEITWQRFDKTIRAGRASLARYVATLMPEHDRQLAERFLSVDRNPDILTRQESFSEVTPRTREIVLYGLRQMAVRDGDLAWRLAQDYDARLGFSESEKQDLQRYIIQRLQIQGHIAASEQLLLETPELISEVLLSRIVRDAVGEQDWPRVERWLELMPSAAAGAERWQYWRARALSARGDSAALAEAKALREAVAKTRSYFGFLAADQLGVPYEYAEQAVLVSQEQMAELYSIPAIVRAQELYLVGDESAARNEWQFATASMSEEQIKASGKLAESWNWHRNSIQAMIQIQYWDDLQLRFPLAYAESFESTAAELGLPAQLIYAVARQESAFMHDVRSSAGAMGLMQLMPATGRETASKAGLRIDTQDLLKPELNIALGARYLSSLLEDFGNNRILAAAAYNAGPNRVKQWQARTAQRPVPFDVWIETIPYGETRNYVESVLTYAVIYGYRSGDYLALLTEQELATPL